MEIRSAMASHYIYLPAIALILVFAISAIHMTHRWMDVDHYWNNINDLLDGKVPYSVRPYRRSDDPDCGL